VPAAASVPTVNHDDSWGQVAVAAAFSSQLPWGVVFEAVSSSSCLGSKRSVEAAAVLSLYSCSGSGV
jgi:hypothetical protein